jgi:hypothetical protein
MNSFLPSLDGFRFPNSFRDGPVVSIHIPMVGTIGVGNAAGGLCGGMVYAALDFYHGGIGVPIDTEPPQQGSQLFDYIAKRLIDSFDVPFGIMKYFAWMSHRGSLYSRTIDEAIAAMDQADNSGPVPLGLIRVESINPVDLGHNHQVLAYGSKEIQGGFSLLIYDPNYPNDDKVSLDICKGEVNHSIDGPIRGLFRSKYTFKEPLQCN